MVLSISYCLLAALPVVLGILRGVYKNIFLIPFILFISYSLLDQLTMVILAKNGIRNVWLINVWLLVQFSFLAIFFIRLFYNRFIWRWFILSVIPALSFFIWGINKINQDNIPLQTFVHLSIGIASCVFLIRIMINTKKKPTQLSLFWICVGLAVYFLGSNLVFSITSLFDAGAQNWLADIYRVIVFILIVLSNLFYSIGLLCSSKSTTSRFS